MSKSFAGVVPDAWMPAAKITGIVVHWTAGGHKASKIDLEHYHILIEADGKVVKGNPSIAANGLPRVRPGYAAHTRSCNSGFIGVSLCGMAGAVERPFNAGKSPLTEAEWDKLPFVLAALCDRYGIAVSPRTVLSHAEVQSTLGIKQNGKWDIARLPFDASLVGAKAVGDRFRSRASALLKPASKPVPVPPKPVAPPSAPAPVKTPLPVQPVPPPPPPPVKPAPKVEPAKPLPASRPGWMGWLKGWF